MAQHTNTRRHLLKVAAAGAVTATSGCLGGGNSSGGGDTSELNIGLMEPMSGVASFYGQAEQQGAQLAARDLEDELDITINLNTADTEADPEVAVDRLERLVTRDGIDTAMGGVTSFTAIQMGNWATNNGLTFMASGPHSDEVSGSACSSSMYMAPSSNTMLSRSVGQAMTEHADSWFLIYGDYSFAQKAREATSAVLQNNGSTVVGSASSGALGTQDYSQVLNQAANSDADAIGIMLAGLDLPRVINQYVNKGLHNEMKMGGQLMEDEIVWQLDKEVVQHIGVWGQTWGPAIETSSSEEFITRIREEYDTTAYSRHYLGYTALDQLVRAVNRAGSTDPGAIRDELDGHEYTDHGLLDGTQYWRACNHLNITPTYAVEALPAEEMQDDPHRVWFEQIASYEGDDVARACGETGCSF